MLTCAPSTEMSLSQFGNAAQAESSRGGMKSFPLIYFLNVRAERAQAVHKILITALNPFYIMNLARAVRRERRQHQRGTSAQVGAVNGARAQARRPGHHAAMRVAEHNIGAHLHQLIGEEHAP